MLRRKVGSDVARQRGRRRSDIGWPSLWTAGAVHDHGEGSPGVGDGEKAVRGVEFWQHDMGVLIGASWWVSTVWRRGEEVVRGFEEEMLKVELDCDGVD